jgi:hypothetical protein
VLLEQKKAALNEQMQIYFRTADHLYNSMDHNFQKMESNVSTLGKKIERADAFAAANMQKIQPQKKSGPSQLLTTKFGQQLTDNLSLQNNKLKQAIRSVVQSDKKRSNRRKKDRQLQQKKGKNEQHNNNQIIEEEETTEKDNKKVKKEAIQPPPHQDQLTRTNKTKPEPKTTSSKKRFCEICRLTTQKSKDNEPLLLLCVLCDDCYHLSCVKNLAEMPAEGNWICPPCIPFEMVESMIKIPCVRLIFTPPLLLINFFATKTQAL